MRSGAKARTREGGKAFHQKTQARMVTSTGWETEQTRNSHAGYDHFMPGKASKTRPNSLTRPGLRDQTGSLLNKSNAAAAADLGPAGFRMESSQPRPAVVLRPWVIPGPFASPALRVRSRASGPGERSERFPRPTIRTVLGLGLEDENTNHWPPRRAPASPRPAPELLPGPGSRTLDWH